MPWIFGSFLVTPCALTSCHVVINKQGSTIRADGYNRCLTGRSSRDENHAVRCRQIAENLSWARIRSRLEASLTSLQWDASVALAGYRWGIWEREVLSLWVYVTLSISQLTTNCGPFSRVKWEIYFHKEEFRSFIEFRIIIMAIQHWHWSAHPKVDIIQSKI